MIERLEAMSERIMDYLLHVLNHGRKGDLDVEMVAYMYIVRHSTNRCHDLQSVIVRLWNMITTGNCCSSLFICRCGDFERKSLSSSWENIGRDHLTPSIVVLSGFSRFLDPACPGMDLGWRSVIYCSVV